MTETPNEPVSDVLIRLDRVAKTYPGADVPAVSELSMDIHEGELVVFLGPSGCGKTTTMRMINRLIEPTRGRIFYQGDDVTHVDADHLRRRIGYVIQQVGLLPHLTVEANIGMVPRALGWNKKRIRSRVTELLELLGLDPDHYRHRYPRQLSGGEQQRVGAARALAADPPVLLMDEPFGALDPVIRERLQGELLTLQQRIHKTIVFVTHDIAEALRLGDRIAIFERGGNLAQYDTPVRLLTRPANDFVATFIGSGGSVRLLELQQVADIPVDPICTLTNGSAPTNTPAQPSWDARGVSTRQHTSTLPRDRATYHHGSPGARHGRGLVVDSEGHPVRWADASPDKELAIVHDRQTLFDALDAMLTAHDDAPVVLDKGGRPVGSVSMHAILHHIPTDTYKPDMRS